MSNVVVNRNLRTLHEALRVPIAAVKDAAVVVDVKYREQEKELFSSEGASGGTPWPELSPEYKRRKDRLFSGAVGVVREIARARGRRLSGFAAYAVLGAENKKLQLTGDMRRAFATDSPEHVAQGFILPTGARVQVGAQGKSWWTDHVEGIPPLPKRDPQQRTKEQGAELVAAVQRAFVPHSVRTVRDLLRAGSPR